MNELTVSIFDNNKFNLSVVTRDENPIFAIPELGEILDISNISRDIKKYCDECDIIHLSYEQVLTLPNWYSSKVSHQGVNFVNESGLYSLIFASKKPEAKEFKRWVKQRTAWEKKHHIKNTWEMIGNDKWVFQTGFEKEN